MVISRHKWMSFGRQLTVSRCENLQACRGERQDYCGLIFYTISVCFTVPEDLWSEKSFLSKLKMSENGNQKSRFIFTLFHIKTDRNVRL